ncbi:MAG TPA: putative porin [Rariglobus sp.]|nr:putative porin [Rariglobus sp.]
MAKNSLKWLALLGGLTVGSASVALAQDSGPLIDTLVKKGVLTDQEGEDLRVELLKDFGNSSAGKLNISSSLTELKFFGDARVRYEYRNGENGTTGDQLERNRFRYRLRFGATGKFGDGWFFGSRLETSAGNRSTNVTTGNAANSPFAKSADSTIYVGQVYLGRTINDFTFTAGRFANPLVTTPMTWDDDINVEGLAEQWNHVGDNATWIVNLGQYVYEGSGTTNPFGAGASRQSTQLLAFQGGGKFKIGSGSLQVLPTYYYYTGNATGMTALTTPNSATLQPQGLSIVDIPLEYAFKIGSLPAKVWGDYAVNLDADDRARAAGVPAFDGEDTAWQVGFALGQTKAKGDWETRVFYQQVDAFALDSNLVDSDLFDSRTNMEGYGISFAYVPTTGVTLKLTYAQGDRHNDGLATFGAGDITTATLTDYQLFQADVSVKF